MQSSLGGNSTSKWIELTRTLHWNHSLKIEAIHGERFATREQARAHVFEYIEVDYNRTRLHSTLGYLSPEQYELAHVA
jgi:transposase InsO family protein